MHKKGTVVDVSADRREAGVLLPLSALPARHGVGDMGFFAERFIDLLRQAGARYWQILPIHPLGFGNSPYQPYSSFAGDPLLISLDALHVEGLLSSPSAPFQRHAGRIDYAQVRAYKDAALKEAFAKFTPTPAYEAFIKKPWVYPFSVFMAFKKANGMRCWLDWPKAQRDWPRGGGVDLSAFDEAIRFEMFSQHVFDTQWGKLKRYANERGVRIIGDIPIYVGLDSADVWAGRENFLLDGDGRPTFVAGVPPDYFSKTGQRWGNPLYDWAYLEKKGFSFWIERLRGAAELFDVVRIDHFRGFDTYWKIPADCPTAEKGAWVEAPGYRLFDAVYRELPGLEVIAEDLGLLRDEVYALRDHYDLPGMNVLQFTFVPGRRPTPERDRARMAVYTGTHDNQTTEAWYRALPLRKRLLARGSLWACGIRGGRMAERFVRLALRSAAELAVIPAQDLMGLPDGARINTPGTVGSPNWEWKLSDLAGLEEGLRFFKRALHESGRAGFSDPPTFS